MPKKLEKKADKKKSEKTEKKPQVKAKVEKPAKVAKAEKPKAKEEASVNKAIAKEPKVEKAPKVSRDSVPAEKPKKSKKEVSTEVTIAAASENEKKWLEYYEKHKAEKTHHYAMSATFEPNTPLNHKILGWGYILSVQNDRLEVIFKDGVKMLISNYQVK